MDTTLLNDLEERIAAIEEKVLPKHEDDKKLMKVLTDVDETLTTFSTKRERFNQIFKRVPAITEYLSPGFIDTISMGDACRKEVVLSEENGLILMSKHFEEIQQLSGVLDSPKIQEIPNHQKRLNKLEVIQQHQLEDLSSSSEGLNNLLLSYNELVNSLSENFVKWDWTLSMMEDERQEKED